MNQAYTFADSRDFDLEGGALQRIFSGERDLDDRTVSAKRPMIAPTETVKTRWKLTANFNAALPNLQNFSDNTPVGAAFSGHAPLGRMAVAAQARTFNGHRKQVPDFDAASQRLALAAKLIAGFGSTGATGRLRFLVRQMEKACTGELSASLAIVAAAPQGE